MQFGYFTLSDNNYVANRRGANEFVENVFVVDGKTAQYFDVVQGPHILPCR